MNNIPDVNNSYLAYLDHQCRKMYSWWNKTSSKESDKRDGTEDQLKPQLQKSGMEEIQQV